MRKGDNSQNYAVDFVDSYLLSSFILNYNVPGSPPHTPTTQNTQRACPRLDTSPLLCSNTYSGFLGNLEIKAGWENYRETVLRHSQERVTEKKAIIRNKTHSVVI